MQKIKGLDYLAWLAGSFLVCCVYFALASFGLGWSQFTSGITLVWPAAGLALFCCLKFGWRILPGVFFGSFLATVWLHFGKQFTLSWEHYLLAACMALADSLQAFWIARMNRRLVRRDFNFSILRLLPFAASIFIGCLVSSSIGTLILHQLDLVSSDELLKSWLFWWMGDSAGMLVFAPLLFWISTKKIRQNNPKARAFLLLSTITGMSIFIFAAISYIDAHKNKQQNELASQRLQVALENRLELSLRDLDVMNRFYYKIYPTEKDFVEVSKPLLERSPWINQMVWLPLNSIRSNVQSYTWAFGVNDRGEADPSAILIPIIKATQENRQVFASSFLQKNPEQMPKLYLFHPIEDCLNRQIGKCSFRGWVVADIEIKEWLNYALEQITRGSQNTLLEISNQQQTHRFQYIDKSWTLVHAEALQNKQLLITAPWPILNHQYSIRIYATDESHWQPRWPQIIALVCCLLVLSLLIAYLYAQQKHDDLIANNQEKLQQEVDFHTRSLRTANDWLLKEIADRQEAQELLQQSQDELEKREQHLRSLLDNIPDPVWFKDKQGIYQGCNQAFARFMGKSERDIIGSNEYHLVAKEKAEEFRLHDEEAIKAAGRAHRYEQWLLAADGSPHLLDILKVGLTNHQGETVGVLGIARDATEKHQLITELQLARDHAEEATKSKSRFLANMSHEIRTPLNAVLGYAQLLMRDKDIGPRQQEKLSSILTSGHKLLGLINDILDLSKIESGAIQIKKDFFDLHQEIATVQTVVSDRAKAKNLTLAININLPKPFVVSGDRQKLGQILINLLSNAIKFTFEGQISLDVFVSTQGVEFVVADTGMGISEKELGELFVAFKQGSAGEQAGGTGLGLTLSRHLAEAMGGSLQLKSQIAIGTTATLRLPLQQESVQLTDQFLHHSQSIRFATTPRILVVEDDIASNQILSDLLRQTGCEVNSAFNGKEGLQQAQANSFDLIFTDIRMPDMNGLEMLQALRKLDAYQTLPIIAVSASSLEHERDYYLAKGFQHFVGKPYSFDEIYQCLIEFAQAEVIETASHELQQDVQDQTETIDWAAATPALKRITAFAAQGDMTNVKLHISKLSAAQIGKSAYQQLTTAIKQYDLELIEKLIKGWLEQN